jgi:SEL1 protein
MCIWISRISARLVHSRVALSVPRTDISRYSVHFTCLCAPHLKKNTLQFHFFAGILFPHQRNNNGSGLTKYYNSVIPVIRGKERGMVTLIRLVAALSILVTVLSCSCIAEENANEAEKVEERVDVVERGRQLIESGSYEQAWDVLSNAEPIEKQLQPDLFYYLGHMCENGLGKEVNYSAAFHEYLNGANAGSAKCQMQASVLLSNGHGVKVDEGASVLLLTMASVGRNIEAKVALGNRYQHGIGVEKSCFQALGQMEPCARRVFLLFQANGLVQTHDNFKIGSEDGMEFALQRENLLDMYAEEAAEGNAAAQSLIGISHLAGANGVQRNTEIAREYLEQAARNGDAQAQTALAQMYVAGIGVDKDNATALRYFLQAAKNGDAGAMNGLGYMYLNGIGVTEDHKVAVDYFERAAQTGSGDAYFNLGAIFSGGTSSISANEERGLEYFMKAAHMHHVGGMYHIGRFYYLGKDVKINCETALSYLNAVTHNGPECGLVDEAFTHYRENRDEQALMMYTKAAEMGLKEAEENVAYMYEHRLGVSILDFDGFGDEMDDESFEQECDVRALHWYGRAASRRSITAINKVGDHHYYGIGTARNASLALRYYESAAGKKSAQAHFNLGCMKQRGIGVPRDFIGARKSFILSLTEDPKGYLPVKMALMWLRMQEQWDRYVGIQLNMHGFKLFVLSIRFVDVFLIFTGLIMAILGYIRVYA